IALAATILVSACTVVVEEPSRPGLQMCTRHYDPVCARRGSEVQTFSNACMADRAGFRIIHNGECRRPPDRDQRFCTREYRPVCARSGSRLQTCGNACEAESAGWRIVRTGRC